MTRPQNGHWKSENSTIVTFAFAGPFIGPSSGTRTRSTPSPAVGAPGAAAAALVDEPLLSRVASLPRP